MHDMQVLFSHVSSSSSPSLSPESVLGLGYGDILEALLGLERDEEVVLTDSGGESPRSPSAGPVGALVAAPNGSLPPREDGLSTPNDVSSRQPSDQRKRYVVTPRPPPPAHPSTPPDGLITPLMA